MLLRCPIEDFNLCESCPYYDFVAFELDCQGDCPTCPTATVNCCPCADVERVRSYWRDRKIDDHVLLAVHLLVDSTLDEGDRMLVAVRAAGLGKVPCIIRERLTDEQALTLIHDVNYYFGQTIALQFVNVQEGGRGAYIQTR
jgi:hypothetical protein